MRVKEMMHGADVTELRQSENLRGKHRHGDWGRFHLFYAGGAGGGGTETKPPCGSVTAIMVYGLVRSSRGWMFRRGRMLRRVDGHALVVWAFTKTGYVRGPIHVMYNDVKKPIIIYYTTSKWTEKAADPKESDPVDACKCYHRKCWWTIYVAPSENSRKITSGKQRISKPSNLT